MAALSLLLPRELHGRKAGIGKTGKVSDPWPGHGLVDERAPTDRCHSIYHTRGLHLSPPQRSALASTRVMFHLRWPRHPRLTPRPCLRSFAHSRRPAPSSAYLDRSRGQDESTTSTPDDLSSSQRRLLEAALRVDQAGEVAANYIYKGQLAILRHDPATASLIQASLRQSHSVSY